MNIRTKTYIPLVMSLIVPFLMLALAILLSRSVEAPAAPARVTPSADYPYGYTTRVLVDISTGIANSGTAWKPTISADGRYVAFYAGASLPGYKLPNGGSAYVYDRKTGDTVLASVGQDGQPVAGSTPVISANGRYVAFTSYAWNNVNRLGYPMPAVYVRDLEKEQTILISRDTNDQPANGHQPSISADGRYVEFESAASNLVRGDTNQVGDIFVFDRQTGETRRASVASDGTEADGPSTNGVISGSGRYVAFFSQANNLGGEKESELGIYLHDLETGKTFPVSAGQGIPINQTTQLAIDAGGRFVLFLGGHTAFDPKKPWDYGLYIYDRGSGIAEYLVKDMTGQPAKGMTYMPSISADGRYVAFVSFAPDLVAGEADGYECIYVLDRQTGAIRCASVSSQNAHGDNNSYDPAISADGQHVVFGSDARNLVAGYPRGAIGVYIHDFSNWGDYPSIDARRFGQATPYQGPYPPPTPAPRFSPYPVPYPVP